MGLTDRDKQRVKEFFDREAQKDQLPKVRFMSTSREYQDKITSTEYGIKKPKSKLTPEQQQKFDSMWDELVRREASEQRGSSSGRLTAEDRQRIFGGSGGLTAEDKQRVLDMLEEMDDRELEDSLDMTLHVAGSYLNQLWRSLWR